MTRDDLRTITAYCANSACGDPVAGVGRTPQYTKRQLVFAGFFLYDYAKYVCPVCGSTQYFRPSLLRSHYVSKTPGAVRHEVLAGVLAIIAIIIIGSIDQWITNRHHEDAVRLGQVLREAA